MENIELSNVVISALACAVPSKKVKVEDYEKYFGEKKIKKFIKTTGIKERHIGNGMQTASDLCYVAAEHIFSELKIEKEDIDLVIFETQTADYKTPSTAFVLQKRLGLSMNCTCFDMNIGCTAFLHGIYVAGSMIQARTVKKALVMIGDCFTSHAVNDNTADSMMFGDAGAAIVLESGTGKIPMTMYSDGNRFSTIMNACGERFQRVDGKPDISTFRYYMDGGEVFNFALETVPDAIQTFCKKTSTCMDDYDYLIMHQANLFILKHIANMIGVDMNKIPISIDRYGNTNGVSIPCTVVDLIETVDNLPDVIKLLVTGFGVGLSWGVMSVDIHRDCVLPFIFTNDYYIQGKDIDYLKGDNEDVK